MKRSIHKALLAFVFLFALTVGAIPTMLTHPSTAHASVSGFVTRSGSQLQLNGSNFRFSGTNIYWVTVDEVTSGNFFYPSQFRVDDAFATAQEMGATVVRSVNGVANVGCNLCIEPSLGSFNAAAFQQLDYAIKSAGDHGIRLIFPLVDNFHYDDGGKHTFTDWRGLSNEDDFYTNTTVIGDFEQFISKVLNHVNTYTGVAYKDDPTILAWEEGNELTDVPVSWASRIADYIKGIDGNHLLSFSNNSPNPSVIQQDTLSIGNIDMEDSHFYPMNVSQLNSDASLVTSAGKVFYVGEYDWDNVYGGDSLSSFLSAVESNGASGDAFWALFPHDDTYGYVQRGFALHYPGDTSDMRSRAQAMRTHAYTMRRQSVPADGIPAAPLITSVGGQAIAWRGSTPSATYSVERSTAGSNGPWTVICNQCATDNDTPWTDSTQPTTGTLWYQVQGYNLSGVAGPFSLVYQYNHSPSNLIGDPGYEQQGSSILTSPWSPDLHDSSCAAGVNIGSAAHSGNNDGWIYCNGNNASVTWAYHDQIVSVTPNTAYTLTVWVNNTVGTIGNNGLIQVASVPWSNQRYTNFTPPQNSYAQETFQFTTLASETQILVEVGYAVQPGTATAMTLDDWNLTTG